MKVRGKSIVKFAFQQTGMREYGTREPSFASYYDAEISHSHLPLLTMLAAQNLNISEIKHHFSGSVFSVVFFFNFLIFLEQINEI